MKKLLAILLFLTSPAFAANPPIDVTAYSAIPDAVYFDDCTASGTGLVCPSAAFMVGDAGKHIKVTKGYNNDAVYLGTISSRTNATTLVLGATITTACTGDCHVSYGTDNTTALQNAINAATSISSNTKVRVWGPSNPNGGGYIVTSQLTSDNIAIDFQAPVYSHIGIGSGDNTIPWDLGNSDIISLKMNVQGGRGPRWGNTLAHGLKLINLDVSEIGFNGQQGLTCRGYGFDILGTGTVHGGSKGFDWTDCQDIHGGHLTAVGSNDPFIFSGSEDVQLDITCDSTSNNCWKIDASHNVTLNSNGFVNHSSSVCTGKIGSVSSLNSSGIVINHLAQACGGKAIYVANVDGGVKINVTATNQPLNSTTVNTITYCAEYGSDLNGSLDVSCTHDSDISLFTGTLYGNITDHSGDDYVSSTVLLAGKIALTSTVAANITSVSLKGGPWLCYGNELWEVAGTASWGILALNNTSATLPTAPNEGGYAVSTLTMTAGYFPFYVQKRYVMPSAGGTVYLIADMQFAGGATNVYGSLNCQRVQ